MAWAKLHTDILGDPKLMRAARKGARGLVYLPWLIAFAKQADDGGCLTVGGEPAEPADVAALVPGATAPMIAAALDSLEAIGVLERDPRGALCFARWAARSETKPSDSASAIADRVRRHRDRHRNAEPSVNGNAESSALHETPGNALHETPDNALHETPDNATEKRRGEEKREEKRRGEARRVTPAWVAPVVDRWTSRVGRVAPEVVLRELEGAADRLGEAALVRAIDAYADARLAASKPCKLEWFAAEAAVWVERSAPVVDAETGLLNERGIAILEARP